MKKKEKKKEKKQKGERGTCDMLKETYIRTPNKCKSCMDPNLNRETAINEKHL